MKYNKLAYGTPKKLNLPKGSGSSIIEGTSAFGVKVVQAIYLRPPKYGYEAGRRK